MAITDNLEGYWSLEEASGTRVDQTENENDLTDNNTVGQGTLVVGNCADHERSNNEFLSITNALQTGLDPSGNQDFHINMWVELETKSAVHYIVAKNGASAGTTGYIVYYDHSNNRAEFWVRNSGDTAWQNVNATNQGALDLGTKYNIQVWHDATNDLLGIQVNGGTPNTVAASGGVMANTKPFTIGGSVDLAAVAFDGLIDEVGFWSRVLTSDERDYMYNDGNGRSYAEISAVATASGWWFE